MIDLVLAKKNMLRYVQDLRTGRGMGRASQITMVYYVKSGWRGHGYKERGSEWS